MKDKIKKISRVLFSLLLIVSILGTINVLAEEVIFKITNISVNEKSSGVTVNDVSLSGETITNDVVFTDKDDYIKYEITLKNNTSDKYKILSISDDNDSEYLDYTYDDLSNIELNGGDEKTFTLTITYKKETTNSSIADKVVNLTLNYEKEDGTTGTTAITNNNKITNPKTGDNITLYIILGLVSITGLVITTVSRKRLSKSLMVIALTSTIILPLGVKANSNSFIIKFNNSIKEKEYTVTFNSNGGSSVDEIKVVKGNKVTKPSNDPEKDNKDFGGWYTTNSFDLEFDFDNTTITTDTEIFAKWDNKKTLEVGDLINYNANRKDKNGSSFDEPYTYTTTREEIDSYSVSSFSSLDNMSWKVLEIDENTGKIIIVAATDTPQQLTLNGAVGFKNAERLLNDIASVYGHGYGAKTVRSITIEDIEKYSSYDITTNVNSYGIAYGEEGIFPSSNLHAFKELSKTVDSNGVIKVTYDSDFFIPNESNPAQYTNTAYEYDPVDYMDEKIYKILIKDNKMRNYFQASRAIEFTQSTPWWVIRQIQYGKITYATLGWGINQERHITGYYTYRSAVCPIIELDPNVELKWDKANNTWNIE